MDTKNLLKMDVSEMVAQIARAQDAEALLASVAARLRNTPQWLEFMGVVVNDTLWTPWPGETIRGLLDDETIHRLLPRHGETLETILRAPRVDGFWQARVRHYLMKGDHERAWEELLKGFHGVRDGLSEAVSRNHRRHFCASPNSLAKLALELAEVVGWEGFETLDPRWRGSSGSHAWRLRQTLWGELQKDPQLQDRVYRAASGLWQHFAEKKAVRERSKRRPNPRQNDADRQ